LLKVASFASLPGRVTGLTWVPRTSPPRGCPRSNRSHDGEYELTFAIGAIVLPAGRPPRPGCPAFDTVDVEFRDAAAVERRARASRRRGFVGKLAIHPAQVAPIHAAFTPTAEEIAWAQRVVAAFARHPGRALAFEGGMLDRPHLRQAERILAAIGRG